jgi:hypothetical protein
MPASFRIHRFEDILDAHPEDYKPFYALRDKTITVNRGDRVIITDIYTKQSLSRDVADASQVRDLDGATFIRLYMMRPEVRFLRQISVTNHCGQTSVIWVGEDRALKVGKSVRLHDDFDEWRIDGLFTTMAPHALPESAKVVHVQQFLD